MRDTCRSKTRHNFRGSRDAAIIRLLATTGMRLSELTNLAMDDLDLTGAENEQSIPTARVYGKGRRWRRVPLDEATVAAIRTYLTRERPRHPLALTSPSVWLAPRGPMTDSGTAQIIRERGKAAGLDPEKCHPHALRHHMAHTLLDAGMSEGDVMAIGGWKTRSMLDRYGAAMRAERAQAAFLRAPRPVL